MNFSRLTSVFVIFIAATLAWIILGVTLNLRSTEAEARLGDEVKKGWGPGLIQPHLSLLIDHPTDARKTETLQASSTRLDVALRYAPHKRGLLWHRTYEVDFQGQYEIFNDSSSPRNVRVQLRLPSNTTSYDDFVFKLGAGSGKEVTPRDGLVEMVMLIPAATCVPLTIGYKARGLDRWGYTFAENSRLKNFSLKMKTDFDEIDFPAGATSPTGRFPAAKGQGWDLEWNYRDVLDARDIAMEMPDVLNAGPVLARITFFAPVSLFLFFVVLIIATLLQGVNLHPVRYGFLAAGFFSFHLLLAYLGDQLPLLAAFLIATVVSLLLVWGYLQVTVGNKLSWIALSAQLAYMVLFSYSFLFEGLTGLILTIAGIITLALLMLGTAKVDWEKAARGDGELVHEPSML